MLKRFSLLALLVILAMVFSAGMAMAIVDTAIVSLDVPAVLTITLLDDFSLVLPGGTVPGTATGSDTFAVTSNGALGVTVTGACSVFSPSLVDTTVAVVMSGATSGGPATITPTATLSVDVALADATGGRTATLTITAVNNVP